jgi:lipopolysaccharide assembly protein B
MTPELFAAQVIVLFLAAAAGWYFARHRSASSVTPPRVLKAEYFEGLNFVLSEQPDKALEVFLRLVEVDDETVETHFALGALYRRRGEVNLSIRVHENIMARPALQTEHREHAMFALGEDYFRAGLFDRAEQLFQRLGSGSGHCLGALRYLLRIYEQQGEWVEAIATYERLKYLVSPEYPTAIAHYYCELAEAERLNGNFVAARSLLHKVRAEQRNFPRSALLRADIALAQDEPDLALRLCRRVVELHPHLLPMALPRFMAAMRATRNDTVLEAFHAWLQALPGRRAEMAYAAIVAGLEDEPFVIECLREFIRVDPNLGELVPALAGDPASLSPQQLQALAGALGRIFRRTHRYRCVECGLASATHFWQCPGCRSWDGLSPIARLELVSRPGRV